MDRALAWPSPTVAERELQTTQWTPPRSIPQEERFEAYQVTPGTRLYFANRNELTSLDTPDLKVSHNDFKDDFNAMLYHFENKERKLKTANDICFWAINVSPKKIHLA